MAKPQADVEFVTHTKQALAAVHEYERAFMSMLSQMDNRTKKTGKSSKDVSKTWANMGASIGRATASALGFLGVMQTTHTVSGLVRKEIEQIQKVQGEATATTIPFNDAMEEIRLNLPQGATASMPEIRDMIIGSNSPFKTELANQVYGAISAGLSNDTAMLTDTAIRVAEARPDLARSNPDSLKALIEAVVESQRVYGGTVEEQLAMLQIGSSTARTTDMGTYSKYVASAAAQAKKFGFTQQEGLAIASAFGTSMNDPDGATTMTNVLSMMAQTAAEGKMLGMQETGMALINRIRDPNDELGSQLRHKMLGVLEAGMTQEEIDQVAQFKAGKLRGRMRAKPTMVSFLQPNGIDMGAEGTKALYDNAMKGIPKSFDDAMKRFNADMAARDSDPYYRSTLIANRIANFAQQMEISPAGALRGQLIDAVGMIHEKTGGSAFTKGVETFLTSFQVGSMSPSEVVQKLADEVNYRQAEMIRTKGEGFTEYTSRLMARRNLALDNEDEIERLNPQGKLTKESVGDALRSMPEYTRKELEFTQQFETLLREMLEQMKKPQPVKDVNPKLQDPAKPNAVGVANQ